MPERCALDGMTQWFFSGESLSLVQNADSTDVKRTGGRASDCRSCGAVKCNGCCRMHQTGEPALSLQCALFDMRLLLRCRTFQSWQCSRQWQPGASAAASRRAVTPAVMLLWQPLLWLMSVLTT